MFLASQFLIFIQVSFLVVLIFILYLWLVMVTVGAESVVYEGTLDGMRVAVKKPILSTSEDINKFHKELQLLWYLSLYHLNFLSFNVV